MSYLDEQFLVDDILSFPQDVTRAYIMNLSHTTHNVEKKTLLKSYIVESVNLFQCWIYVDFSILIVNIATIKQQQKIATTLNKLILIYSGAVRSNRH